MSSNLHPMLNVAIKAARTAGTIINRAALDVESVRVAAKQTNDFVTEIDQAAEKAIIETLLTAYPDHGIWAEESGQREGRGRDDGNGEIAATLSRWRRQPVRAAVADGTGGPRITAAVFASTSRISFGARNEATDTEGSTQLDGPPAPSGSRPTNWFPATTAVMARSIRWARRLWAPSATGGSPRASASASAPSMR